VTAVERNLAEAALHESERQLAKELAGARILQRVSTELMSESEPVALYVKLVDAAIALMAADAGSFQMLEDDGTLRLLASRHFDPQSEVHWHSVSVDSACSCGLALARNERVIVSDVEASDIMAGTSDLEEYRRSRLRAVQSTPLVARDGRAVGMLSTHWHETHEPSASEFALFDVLARQAADLLDRMRAQTASRERADWLTGLHALAERLLSITDLPTAMSEVLDAAIAFHTADRGTIQIYDAQAQVLRYAAARGFDPNALADIPPIDRDFHSTCAVAIRTGERVVATDLLLDPRWADHAETASALDYRAALSTVMKTRRDELLGVLTVHFRQPHTPTERELGSADLYARLAAHVIERGHAEAALRDREQRLRSAVSEREALLKELHHRVKNNLQVIASLLEMQTRRTADREALTPLVEARNRITAIAAIHELLYQSESLSDVDLTAYARRLLPHVASLYDEHSRVTAAVDGDDIRIDLARAVPFGLLLNELVSNVYKHAFRSEASGQLRVAFARDNGHIRLSVMDTGIGLPPGFNDRPAATLGLYLVRMLAKQLGGTVNFESTRGTNVEVLVPFDDKPGSAVR
jgi:two-component sensor histidine kinase